MANRKGFTVLELIIYLGILASALLINLMLISIINQKHPDEALFWRSFQTCWSRTQQQAIAKHCKYEVLIEAGQGQIAFIPYQASLKKQILQCPRQIRPHNTRRLFINPDGYSSPTTVYWQADGGKRIYLQKIQLGWSGFKVEQK
ncbi:prepilin-type N-terminal cleavage/methylation domain-containing protein [Lentilactobacillus farraginis]|uniref:Uncharacterized protein n=1 Tax=Lentilactobacillus farraginis DSM 18382 = JCM 14108 TaxID=1423743 RepID=A0A0R1W618_9LACO|nr:prepilin-type N-terminal cleavage/methylation domain-containing protein [Lentilactobacillus farraginis]KRM10028.1 hypothetical protein FD41_GL002210 [Lentilactobacillus farraginis DSM 18382 = JCM 14108]